MITTQEHNVPALRFPEFGGEWVEERFEKSSLSIKSGRSSYQDSGEFPIYGSTGQIGFSGEYEFDRPAILVARVGANAGRINRAKGKYGVTDNTLVILLNEHTDFDFAVSLLVKKNLNRFVFGSGQPLITGTMPKRIKCIIPPLPEQQKIASFLSSVDTKIEQTAKKKALLEKYKKGMMQNLFSQALRFKDEQGNDFPDWEEMPFSDVLKPVPTKQYQINNSQFLEQGAFPVVDQGKKLIAGYSDDKSKVFPADSVIVYGDHTTIIKLVDFDFIVGADGTKVLKSLGPDTTYLYYESIPNLVEISP